MDKLLEKVADVQDTLATLNSGTLSAEGKAHVLSAVAQEAVPGSPAEASLMDWADQDPDINWIKGESWPPK